MRKWHIYFGLTVIVALAILFIARQRTLNDLRAGNDSLRKQVEMKRSAFVPDISGPQMETVARLSEVDEKELLQLRSRIGPLREQLRDMSNRVVILQRLPKSR
jgi:hypothetical protein